MEPFIPQSLPPKLDWQPLIPLIGGANRALASYEGSLLAVPSAQLMLSPLTTQEAVLSSRIEGTQATLGEVLQFEAGEQPKRDSEKEDIREILNYRKALLNAESEVARRQFSLSILQSLHAVLLADARGSELSIGRYRSTQNWIGDSGTPIERARFVPPPPLIVPEHMDAWEAYYRSEQPDPIVQLAIIHAQFEIIHPFVDGNGRLGRMLVPLFLFEKKLLARPTFYLSAWLEENRAEYVARLSEIGRSDDGWDLWVAFFLRAVQGQARRNDETVRRIVKLYEWMQAELIKITHSKYSGLLLDNIFTRPVFRSATLQLGDAPPTRPAINNWLNAMCDAKVLRVLRKGAGRRPTVYMFPELINICEGRQVF